MKQVAPVRGSQWIPQIRLPDIVHQRCTHDHINLLSTWIDHDPPTACAWFVCFFLWCTRVLSPRCLYLVNSINVCVCIYIYMYLPVCKIYVYIYIYIYVYICVFLNNTTKHLCYESQANRAQLALLLPFGSPLQGPWPWPATNSAGEQCHLIATSEDMLATSKCIGTKKGN